VGDGGHPRPSRGRDVAAEVDEELAFHLAMRRRDYEARGLAPAAAERAARDRFGDVARVRRALVTHDLARERRHLRRERMAHLARDVRLALRGFRRAPAFAAGVVLVLALGIGMATAVAAVADAVLRRPLPVRDQDALALLWTYHDPAVELTPTIDDVRAFARETRALRAVAAAAHFGANAQPLSDGDRPLVLRRGMVSGNYFEVLGARAALGRLLRPDDELQGAPHVLVLSHGAWRRHFGGDPRVVGRRLVEPYSRDVYTVVGVAPPGLDYPVGADYWMPLWAGNGLQEVFVVGRLAPGATRPAAAAELLAVARRLAPHRNLTGATAVPFRDAIVGDVRPALVVLTAAVALLLLIACVNVGSLLLVRAAARAREFAVRRAIGARPGDVVRQLAVESALLGLAGGAAGLACAEGLRRAFVALAPAELPRLDVVRLGGAPLGLALATTLGVVLVVGLFPGLAGARAAPAATLRRDVRSGRGSRRGRAVRRGLVGAQVALAVVMLAGAGLLGRSLARLERLDLGYAAERLAIVSVSWNAAAERDDAERRVWGGRVVEALGAVPGVRAATPILVPPFVGANVWRVRFAAEGQSRADREAAPYLPVEVGGPDYFRTFAMPLVRGRGFTEGDRATAPKVVVVTEAAARRLWPGADPLGRRVRVLPPPGASEPDGHGDWRTVVGVVRDARFRALREPTPTVHLPWQQFDGWQGVFAVRAAGDPAAVAGAVRRAVRGVDPQLDAYGVQAMDELLGRPLAQPRLTTLLLSGFSAAALLLAAVGLYGAVSALVGERTRELGVRMALGAAPGRVRRGVLLGALAVVGGGTVAGLAGALAGARLLGALLYEVRPTDPATLAGVCLLLTGVGLAAAYVPARRATRIDPARALRAE
jgi:predicted permease